MQTNKLLLNEKQVFLCFHQCHIMPPMTHIRTLKGDQRMDLIPPSVQLTLSYDIRLLFENFCHQTSQFPQPFDWSSDLISFE